MPRNIWMVPLLNNNVKNNHIWTYLKCSLKILMQFLIIISAMNVCNWTIFYEARVSRFQLRFHHWSGNSELTR